LFVTFAHVCPRPSLRLHAEMPPEDFVMRISSHGGGGTNENIDAFEMATWVARIVRVSASPTRQVPIAEIASLHTSWVDGGDLAVRAAR
jgi:hypothetical protein